MKFDYYDTYATGHDGSILHFDVIVTAGTAKPVVEEVAAQFAGGHLPEVEAQLRRKSNCNQAAISPEGLDSVKRRGFAIVPLVNRKRLAA